jgi:hypothetical protein
MRHKLIPGPNWEADQATLRDQMGLRQVLDGIADDPFHRTGRYQYRASGIVVDYSADGLAVAYLVLGNDDVVLLSVDEGSTGE